MNKTILFFSVYINLLLPAFGQISLQNLTEHNFGTSFSGEKIQSSIESGDGGLWLAGTLSNGLYPQSTLVRIDANDDTLWTRSYAGYSGLKRMRLNPLGQLMILTDSTFLTVDTDGNWIGSISHTSILFLNDFIYLSDGSIIGVGSRDTVGLHTNLTVISHFDMNGNYLNDFSFYPYTGFWKLIIAFENGFLIGGHNGLSLDPQGQILHVNQFGDFISTVNLYSDPIIDLYSVGSANYTYAISQASPNWFVNNNSNDSLNVAISSPEFCASYFSKAISIGAKGFLALGTDGNNNPLLRQLVIVRYSLNGDSLWSITFNSDYRKEIYDIQNLGNNYYFISGTIIKDTNGVEPDKDIYYARFQLTDPEPQAPEIDLEIDVHPTIFQNEINFTSVLLVPELLQELSFFDLSGRKIPVNYVLSAGNFKVFFPAVSNGIYFYRMKHNGKVFKGKIVKINDL